MHAPGNCCGQLLPNKLTYSKIKLRVAVDAIEPGLFDTFLLPGLQQPSADDGAHRCYACTTVNTTQLLTGVQDSNWRAWLARDVQVPMTMACVDTLTGFMVS